MNLQTIERADLVFEALYVYVCLNIHAILVPRIWKQLITHTHTHAEHVSPTLKQSGIKNTLRAGPRTPAKKNQQLKLNHLPAPWESHACMAYASQVAETNPQLCM